MFRVSLCLLGLAVLLAGAPSRATMEDSGFTTQPPAPSPPNFLLIVADDLGWSDVGVFGGEISTPNLDSIAENGVAMTQFYVAPVCAPSRAMLMTGVDSHAAGVGTLDGYQAPNQRFSAHYKGELLDTTVTSAEALRAKGYQTFMVGKWHLALHPEQAPNRRGFDQSYVLLQGGASHFGDGQQLYPGFSPQYLENGQAVTPPPGFYSTIFYTDKMLQYLSSRDSAAPFFAYVAYTAPHDPLQVPDEWLDRYRGGYDEGPAVIRSRRLERQLEMGLLPRDADTWSPPEFPAWLPMYKPPWPDRATSDKKIDARRMEIYAAMVELLDQQVGRLLEYLAKTGALDNTYVIFMSDNGASGATPLIYPGMTREWFLENSDQTLEHMGKPGSFTYMGMEWANVSVTPWKYFKGLTGDGGIRSPLLARGPMIPTGTLSTDLGHVTDISPTLYELAGVDPATSITFSGKLQPQGSSLLSIWKHDAVRAQERVLNFEFSDAKAVRSGKWKASFIHAPLGEGDWALYDMALDPGEMHDLSAAHPEVLARLKGEYARYSDANGVIVPEPVPGIRLDQLFTEPCNWWCEVRLKVLDVVSSLR